MAHPPRRRAAAGQWVGLAAYRLPGRRTRNWLWRLRGGGTLCRSRQPLRRHRPRRRLPPPCRCPPGSTRRLRLLWPQRRWRHPRQLMVTRGSGRRWAGPGGVWAVSRERRYSGLVNRSVQGVAVWRPAYITRFVQARNANLHAQCHSFIPVATSATRLSYQTPRPRPSQPSPQPSSVTVTAAVDQTSTALPTQPATAPPRIAKPGSVKCGPAHCVMLHEA